MAEKNKEVILIIADISGYTKFMIENKKTLLHAQTVITALIKTVIKKARVPLKIAKLEGDAVFLFAAKENSQEKWLKEVARIKERINAFFTAFKIQALELSRSTTCSCNACTMTRELKLKVVVHYGNALFYKIDGNIELAGTDVILIHRLLKNSISSDEYIAFTQEAADIFNLKNISDFEKITETYDIGTIPLYVNYPGEKLKAILKKHNRKKLNSPYYKIKNMFLKMTAMIPLMSQKHKPHFHNLPPEKPEQ